MKVGRIELSLMFISTYKQKDQARIWKSKLLIPKRQLLSGKMQILIKNKILDKLGGFYLHV